MCSSLDRVLSRPSSADPRLALHFSVRRWLAPVSASDQARELHSFLHCGEVSGLVTPLDAPKTEQRVPSPLCERRPFTCGEL